jgi:hypothetical protein
MKHTHQWAKELKLIWPIVVEQIQAAPTRKRQLRQYAPIPLLFGCS